MSSAEPNLRPIILLRYYSGKRGRYAVVGVSRLLMKGFD